MMRKGFILAIGLLLLYCSSALGQQFKTNISDLADSSVRTLLIPNAFTPNHDGNNDVFRIKNFTSQKLIEFKIFNRWGTILYESKDAHSGWDGNYRGKEQPTGVYGYVIRIAYQDNVVETYKGTVTLLR